MSLLLDVNALINYNKEGDEKNLPKSETEGATNY